MTTHLVIADQDTIDAITDHAEDLASDWPADGNAGEGDWWHIQTHDTWLFRTWDAVTTVDLLADFRYWPIGMPTRIVAERDYPLIAACDLLGVDEL